LGSFLFGRGVIYWFVVWVLCIPAAHGALHLPGGNEMGMGRNILV
jgi:hypothetical protein